MSTNIKVFQIYFKPEQSQVLDPAFTPLDNTANPRPDLREWYNWDQEYEKLAASDLDYWGFVSWKFKEKTNLTGKQVFDHIATNPGYDVYLFNPCIVNEAVFVNSWEQGDIHHPNISQIGNTFLNKLGYDVNVKEILIDRNKSNYANYFVANKKFWQSFMDFTRKLFTEAEKDAAFKHQVFGAGLSNYAYDKSLPNFTFLIERLIPTFIELNNFSSCPYVYTETTILPKYNQVFNDINALSVLKTQINEHGSDELFEVWNFYRRKLLNSTPGLLNLE